MATLTHEPKFGSFSLARANFVLLEDAQEHNLISIAKDARSGTYVINEILEDTT